MRQIGTLADAEQARTFQDYALTLGVKTQVEQDDGGWLIWVFEEDQVERARDALEKYGANPEDPIYREASDAARHLRATEERRHQQARKNVVNVRDQWRLPLTSRAPVTVALLTAMITVAVMSRLGEQHKPLVHLLSIASYEEDGNLIRRRGLDDVRSGEVWRLVTPIFLHFGFVHIIFNSLMFFQLGLAVEMRRGSWRFVLMVLAIAVLSNLGQFLDSGPRFGGMSGVVYGLFGYIWMKSRSDPGSGFYMPRNVVVWLMLWLFAGIFDLIPGIKMANTAHIAGLIVGMILGYAPTLWRSAVRG